MKRKRNIDKLLDEAWSELIKLRAYGKCEYCAKPKPLNSHHIYSRSKRSTRWDPENGVCLCVGHHTFSSTFSAHKTPIEFVEWLEKKKGKDYIDSLRVRANTPMKLNKADKEQILIELTEQIKSYKK